jgi:DNA invertase Pin-like site-specific DNA recombinase
VREGEQPMTKIKAFGYCRVSTVGQIDKGGLPRQRETILQYCKSAKIELVQFYEDSVSGTTTEDERPQFNEMVAALLSDGVSLIVVESLDRLARSIGTQENLLIYLASRENPIDLISANTGENITQAIKQDPMKEALITMQAVFSRLERKIILSRLRKGRETKRKNGGRAEAPPRYAECDKNCTHEIHSTRCQQERQTIVEIAKMRNKPRPLSWAKCAKALNEKDIPPRNADKWSFMLVQHAFTKEKRLSVR